jgi:hypothetical protein
MLTICEYSESSHDIEDGNHASSEKIVMCDV